MSEQNSKTQTPQSQKVALITGANKGIGLELCRQLIKKGLSVIMTARSPQRGKIAVEKLEKEGLVISFCSLDVNLEASVEHCFNFVRENFGRLDYLINNAGVLLDVSNDPSHIPPADEASILTVDIETIRQSMEINTFGAIRMVQRFIPLMKANRFGRIVNISSGMAQLKDMIGGYPAYRISKVGLNAVTRILADELSPEITVVSVCPGWVKTDMGGPGAEIPVSEAAEHIVKTALDFSNTGEFVRFNRRIPW